MAAVQNFNLAYSLKEVNELETNSVNTNMTDLYRARHEFKKGYQPRTNFEKMRMVIYLEIPTILWTDGRITSVSYWMYMALG
jgi:glutaredoxin-related protein